jgi:hypothetical protein
MYFNSKDEMQMKSKDLARDYFLFLQTRAIVSLALVFFAIHFMPLVIK